MKKILHISNYFYPHIGGVEQTSYDILEALKDNYEQMLICFNHENTTIKENVLGYDIVRVKTFAKVASQSISLSYTRELKKIIKVFKPDYIHFHYPNPLVSTALLATKTNAKLIVHWHLDITKQKILKMLFHFQNIKLLKRASQVIVTSPNYLKGSKYLTKFCDKCIVIPSIVNKQRLVCSQENFKNALEIKDKYHGKSIIVNIGRQVEYKGLNYLIEVAKELDDKFVFLLGGEGPLTSNLKSLAENKKNIIFLGKLSDNELKEYLLACDIYVCSSITKNEAFGLSLAEAMYFSNPAITFTILGSGVNYVSLNNITGIEVDNRDKCGLKQAITKLANNPELRNIYGMAAKKRVEELFVFKPFKEKLINLYDGVL